MKQTSLTAQVLNLSIPSALAQAIRLATAFIATLMVARVGATALAASEFVYRYYLFLQAPCTETIC